MGNSSHKDEPPEPELSKEELEALVKRRAAIAREILSTEKSYVTSLDTLIKVYKLPLVESLQSGKPLILKEDVDKIFANIEEIVIVNKKLHIQLDERLVDWDPAKDQLADIFLAKAETLKSYTEYVNNYNNSIKTLSKYSAKKSFKLFLQQQFAKPESLGMEIQSYLIMPIQRIPRYCLLLQELLKCTRRKHKDYSNVSRALQSVKQVADFINEQKREFEMIEHIYDIQEEVNSKYDLVEEHRKVIKEGEVVGSKSARMRYVIFNDALLVASEITGLSSLVEIWRKKHPFDVTIFDSLRRIEALDEPDSSSNWIVTIKADVSSDVTLSFSTEEAKKEFLAEFYRQRARSHRLPPLIKKEKGADSPASADAIPTRSRTDSLLSKILK